MLISEQLKEIYNKYREGKLAHAYLIETNNIPKLIEELKIIIKAISCSEEYHDNCTKCNLCNLIDKNNLPSLITIEPDGTSIKKSQIEELKKSFETKPIYNKYNIYLIKNAEKLNGSSANAMLKFVEEPTEGILGFFITTNKDIIIPTIKSRCQILTVKYAYKTIIEKFNISEEQLNDYLLSLKNYLAKIKTNDLINNKEELLNKYSERKEIELIFKLLFEIYNNLLLKTLNKEIDDSLFLDIIEENSKSIIIKRLNIISNFLHNLSYNVNIELLLDKFVIEMRKECE